MLAHAMRTPSTESLERSYRQHQRLLWGVAYRMTGSAADADDIVQETFARALDRPSPRADEAWRPWLVSVAMNLARDALRRRSARKYVGPWLPSPLGEAIADIPDGEAPADARYELRESASYGFLVALEALTPTQRAVLLLRDVLDYSVREAAAALSLSEANVKVVHHRARAAMAKYDGDRPADRAALAGETAAALHRFLGALLAGDAEVAAACLARDVRLFSDGGGVYRAALRPVVGPDRVVRFFLGLQKKLGTEARFTPCVVNGLPALLVDYDRVREGFAPKLVVRCDVGAAGEILAVYLVLAPEKLTAV
jgi:RNA polymerase sigma-70 factor (ECF subfamily)